MNNYGKHAKSCIFRYDPNLPRFVTALSERMTRPERKPLYLIRKIIVLGQEERLSPWPISLVSRRTSAAPIATAVIKASAGIGMQKGRGMPRAGKERTQPRKHVPTTRQRERDRPNRATITTSPIRKPIQRAAKRLSANPAVVTPPGSQADLIEIKSIFNLRMVKSRCGSRCASGAKIRRNVK